ncbi:MAG: hypothetical protein R2940_10035 [Syntrophotaleaceae bacterium]
MSRVADLNRPIPAFRLRLIWEEGTWSLRRLLAIGPLRLPPSDLLPKIPEGAGRCGFWIELLDVEGRVLFRRTMVDPTEQSVEVFDGGKPRRLPTRRPRAFLDLPVPALSGIASLRIWGQQVSLRERRSRSEVLAHIPWSPLPEKSHGRS